jgi:RND family efflux transporter MFP subunit
VTLEATVEAVRQAVLSTQVPGAIVSLSVKAGDRVRSGQELLRVDARAAQQQVLGSNAQLQAAQAQLRVAALDLNRQKQLFERQFISQGAMDKAQMEFEAAQAQVDAMQAQNKAAQVQTGFYVVHAPYDGIVSDVPVVLGDMAMPGRPLVVMYAPGNMRLSAAVPQSLVPWAKDARSIQYDIEGVTQQTQAASTSELLPGADPATRTLTLRLPLPPGLSLLSPGMAAKVHLLGAQTQSEGRIWVPARALIQRAELTAVRVVNAQGGISLRQVRAGEHLSDQIEILSGLRPGEQVLMPVQNTKTAQEK